MNEVHILPPEIVSKIAAGEVIERPASVIKELMENSFDAGTQTIELYVEQAGKTLIRLKDSGGGISSDDIEKIFNRHATSKLSQIDDLFNIRSLGFRGEALYSIAAVADVIVKSKTKNADAGREIHVRGGKRLSLKPAGVPDGTEIEVRELFFNTPARRKFLKSNTTEINQILNIFIPYALLFPQIRFHLKHQDKVLLDLPPVKNDRERAGATLNLDAAHILKAHHDQPERELSIKMLLGDMNIVRSRRDMQFVFVNGRPVQSKSISYHMNDVYRLILPPGQVPFFALFINIPPGDVDANIHPTKREVKISDEQDICSLLRRICEKTLMEQGEAKDVTERIEVTGSQKLVNKALREAAPADRLDGVLTDSFEAASNPAQRRVSEQYSFPQADFSPQVSEHLFGAKQDSLKGKLSAGRFIGGFMNKFLLFEAGASMLVIDQHAAQERISFEHLIAQMEKGKVEAQQLLSPYVLRLTPQELLAWEEARDRLATIGFATDQFDPETIAVNTYPVLLKDPEQAVREILSGGDAARCDHETLARRACRASVMAGDPLNAQQAEYMREQLLACKDPFTCPHGRPTVVEIKESFLNKQFLRL